MQAYEARLKPFETMEERWKHYPNSAIETRQFKNLRQLIEATQALEQQLKQTNCSMNLEMNQTKDIRAMGKIPQLPEEESEDIREGESITG